MHEGKMSSARADEEGGNGHVVTGSVRVKTWSRLLHSRRCRTAVAGALVVVMSGGVSALVSQALQPAYVVFDMKGTIDTFRQQTAQRPMEKDVLETLTKRFGAALDSSLTAWQEKHNGIVLVKGAVVGGARDITPDIQADIARQMQGTQ